VIAHGDRMGGAGQSMDVTVEDHDHRSTQLIAQPPAPTIGVDQVDRRGGLADHRSHRHVS